MSGKQVAVLIGFAGLLWHVGSIIADAERCKRNLYRYRAAPTVPNFIKAGRGRRRADRGPSLALRTARTRVPRAGVP
jgi:hypothetical protein